MLCCDSSGWKVCVIETDTIRHHPKTKDFKGIPIDIPTSDTDYRFPLEIKDTEVAPCRPVKPTFQEIPGLENYDRFIKNKHELSAPYYADAHASTACQSDEDATDEDATAKTNENTGKNTSHSEAIVPTNPPNEVSTPANQDKKFVIPAPPAKKIKTRSSKRGEVAQNTRKQPETGRSSNSTSGSNWPDQVLYPGSKHKRIAKNDTVSDGLAYMSYGKSVALDDKWHSVQAVLHRNNIQDDDPKSSIPIVKFLKYPVRRRKGAFAVAGMFVKTKGKKKLSIPLVDVDNVRVASSLKMIHRFDPSHVGTCTKEEAKDLIKSVSEPWAACLVKGEDPISQSLLDLTSPSFTAPPEKNASKSPPAETVSANQTELSIINSDVCVKCGWGGELLLCDRCPNSYHMKCLLHMKPENVPDSFVCSENNLRCSRKKQVKDIEREARKKRITSNQEEDNKMQDQSNASPAHPASTTQPPASQPAGHMSLAGKVLPGQASNVELAFKMFIKSLQGVANPDAMHNMLSNMLNDNLGQPTTLMNNASHTTQTQKTIKTVTNGNINDTKDNIQDTARKVAVGNPECDAHAAGNTVGSKRKTHPATSQGTTFHGEEEYDELPSSPEEGHNKRKVSRKCPRTCKTAACVKCGYCKSCHRSCSLSHSHMSALEMERMQAHSDKMAIEMERLANKRMRLEMKEMREERLAMERELLHAKNRSM